MLSKNIEHVLLDTHDEVDNAFRVKLSGVDVNVTAETDSIKIGDESGNLVTTTTVSGSIQALDVVVHDIAISAANDSIAIGDGTDQVTLANFVEKTAANNGVILYSGTGVGKYGPFMPLQATDSGIAKVDSVQLSVSYVSGEFSIGLCRPLITMPMTTIGVASEREFINQLPSMPRVYDGANLTWLLYHGSATPVNSAFYGHLEFGWG